MMAEMTYTLVTLHPSFEEESTAETGVNVNYSFEQISDAENAHPGVV